MEKINPLRAERERQRLSLRELAHFVGCSHTALAKIELGEYDPSPAVKASIARALRVPVRELWPDPDRVATSGWAS
jgi:DNA-binding XRE family transcriptional regulator